MDDIFILEAAHDLDHGVGLADVGKELVAEAFAFRCAADQSGDIDKFDGRGNHLLRFVHFFEHGQAVVRYGDDADIGLDGGKRVVCGKRRFLRGQRVKQCGFPNIGQPDDSSL